MKRLFLVALVLFPLSLWASGHHLLSVAQAIINSVASTHHEHEHDHGKAAVPAPHTHRREPQIVRVPRAPRHHGHQYVVPKTPRPPVYVKKKHTPRQHKNPAQLNTHGHD